MATTPPSINGSDPSIQRQIDRQTASITGKARTAAPIISGDEVVYPRSTTSTSNDAVTITTSVNNDSGDITTVYSTKGQITVNPVNQTINQYTSVDSGVTQIIAGEGVIIDSTTGNGTGVVTINATAGGGNGDYGNSNVANYLPTYTGNVGANWIIADYISGNANPLFNIPGSNVVGTVPNATAAGTVTTAAQPNITSVGTLTGLNVSGNATISGNLTVDGNLVYVNVDTLAVEDPIIQLQTGPNGAAPASNSGKDVGTALNYYDTQARVAFMGWDTSNAEFGLASRASINSEVVTFDTYGNLRVGNINAVGNVNANYFVGVATNVSVEAVNNNYSYHMVFVTGEGDTSLHMDNDDNLQYDPAEGVMTVTRVDMDYLSVGESVISSLVPFDSLPLDLGSNTNRWRDLYLSNSTIYLGNATISSNGNSIVVDSITINDGNIGTIGNIASINLDGNVSNVLAGDGTWVAAGGGGNANLGVFTFANATMSTPDEDVMLIQTTDNNSNLRTQMRFNPNTGIARMLARSEEENSTYTSWSSATYTGTEINVSDSPSLVNFLNNGAFSYGTNKTFSVNGGNRLPYDGYSAGGNNATIYTSVTADPDPTTVTSLEFFYQLESKFEIDYDDPSMNIDATGMSIYIDNDQTQGPDIWLRSGDDITIQGKDKRVGSESEGGDINIYAGDGSGDDGLGNTSSSGGDIQIYAGVGGYGNGSSGSEGGFTRIRAGVGGDAGVTSVAGTGGYVEISAGAGGYNNGNSELGAIGGHVDIYAGQTTLANSVGGNVSIRSGQGGGNAIAGNVQIITPASGPGGGGTWTFDGNGLLTLPGGYIKIGAQYGSDAILASNVAFGIVSHGTSGMSALQWNDDVSNTSQLSAIYVNDPSGNPGDIHIRTGGIGNANVWKFNNDGNLVLPGNTFAVNYANGTQVSLGGGANTGNVTFDNVTVQGDNNSLNLSAGSDFTANLAYLQVRAGDVPSHIHLDTGNNDAYDLIVGDDQNYVQVSSTGNILLSSYDSNTGQYTWTLDYNGNLTLAGGNSVIFSTANSSLDPLNPNVSTMTLTPDANYNSQVLVLDPTAPGHIHLRAYAFSNIDEPSANIFLGGENTAFEITQGSNNVAKIHSGGNTWTFGTDGNLVTPGLTGTYIKSAPGGYMGLAAIDDGGDQPAQLVSINSNSGLGTTAISAYANNALIQANINGDIKSWNFDNTGNLTLPGNTLSINFANNSPAFGNMVEWTTAPVANTSAGTAGQAAYDSGGNLYVCVSTNTWAKFAGTTSW